MASLAVALGFARVAQAEPIEHAPQIAQQDIETAALSANGLRPGDEAPLPQPLKDADAQRYRTIFRLQGEDRFAQADREIAKLDNKLLLGHVLAQRYLAHAYHAKFSELSEWLSRYAELPEAPAIHHLAVSHAPRGAAHHLRRPEGTAFSASPANEDGPAAPRDSSRSEWAAGLQAWRAHRYAEAAHRFEHVAESSSIDSWGRAAGAYWAARSHLRNHEPEKVSRWLDLAGNHPYTFYGILARRLSGESFTYNWALPALTRADIKQIMGTGAGSRGLALVQVGQSARAEQELRRLNPAQPEMAHTLLAVSERADMPALAIQLAEQVSDRDGRRYDAALYPVPSWAPKGGFSVDQALVLALVRQESEFLVQARSPAGARGLMQLMPETARFVTEGRMRYSSAEQLFEPETNLTLGQKYLAHLTTVDGVGDNLFLVVAAYNAGPGNLARWAQETRRDTDPLLFLESIPNLETRHFLERVLANYWIYADQLSEPMPALDELVQGHWPTYKSPDTYLVLVASHGRH